MFLFYTLVITFVNLYAAMYVYVEDVGIQNRFLIPLIIANVLFYIGFGYFIATK